MKVGILGATGAVGVEMRKILEERHFPLTELRLLASSRSKGKKLPFRGEQLEVEEANGKAFEGLDILLSSAGASVSRQLVPKAVEAGCVVIDNTSAFRMEKDVPLVVPEVNPQAITEHQGIIANPNCSTIQMVVVLKPLHDRAKIERVVVSTYQAVSGTGGKAIQELEKQIRAYCEGSSPASVVYPHPIALNLFPHIDVFLEDGSTKEEMKMVNETKKIMGDDSIRVTATCVRVPVFRGHSEAVNIETRKKLSPQEARDILSEAPGVVVLDSPEENLYPVPLMAAGRDETFVGRIREDPTIPHGLNLWIVADNLRKGAALNAIQIAEKLLNG